LFRFPFLWGESDLGKGFEEEKDLTLRFLPLDSMLEFYRVPAATPGGGRDPLQGYVPVLPPSVGCGSCFAVVARAGTIRMLEMMPLFG
jgi:hypothetical protein